MATAGIEYTPNTPLDKPSSMNKNTFRSVDDRRNKMVGERFTGCQFQHPQTQQQLSSPPPYTARTGVQVLPDHHRHLISTNWRNQMAEDAISFQPPVGHSGRLEAATTHHSQQSPMGAAPFRNSDQYFQQAVSYPYIGSMFDAQLDGTFAYCFDRGNGQFTRLIPADMLPPLQNIPATQQGCAGMVVVPQPRGLAPNGHSSNTEPVAVQRSPTTPASPADVIQSRIDNIVANTPPTPTQPTGPSHLTSPGGPGQRRPKVYCDKWVHEGVCAFTQQGCKYKHEMPSDRATQHQLGLFHGYPQWWKKHQAELMRQREPPPPPPPTSPEDAKDDDGSRHESKSHNERYSAERANDAASGGNGRPRGGGGGGGLGLASDTDRQAAAWGRGGEYGSEIQGLGVSFAALKTTPRALGAMRNSMTTGSPGNGLSSRPASYGSPFGPIAPPTRNAPSTFIPNEALRGQSNAEAPHASVRGSTPPRSSPTTTASAGSANSPMAAAPTSNPYSPLISYDDAASDQTTARGSLRGAPSPLANSACLL